MKRNEGLLTFESSCEEGASEIGRTFESWRVCFTLIERSLLCESICVIFWGCFYFYYWSFSPYLGFICIGESDALLIVAVVEDFWNLEVVLREEGIRYWAILVCFYSDSRYYYLVLGSRVD